MNEVKRIKSEFLFPVIKEILDAGTSARITVTGMSMYPFLRENIDSVELTLPYFPDIRRGNIVMVLRDTGEYVMHRVTKKKSNQFYMAGDAQQWIEGPLRPDQLVAVITAVWRGDRKIACTDLRWRLLSSIWLKLLPFRYFIIKVYYKMHRFFNIYTRPVH